MFRTIAGGRAWNLPFFHPFHAAAILAFFVYILIAPLLYCHIFWFVLDIYKCPAKTSEKLTLVIHHYPRLSCSLHIKLWYSYGWNWLLKSPYSPSSKSSRLRHPLYSARRRKVQGRISGLSAATKQSRRKKNIVTARSTQIINIFPEVCLYWTFLRPFKKYGNT